MYAAYSSIERVRLLLKAGADPNIKGYEGMTPVMVAPTPEIIDLLVRHGADVNARDNEKHTALYHVQHGDLTVLNPETKYQMVRLLKAHGAHE